MSSKGIKRRNGRAQSGMVQKQQAQFKLNIEVPPDYDAIAARVKVAAELLAGPKPGEIIQPGKVMQVAQMAPLPIPVVQMFLHCVGDIRSLIYQLNAASEYITRLERVAETASEEVNIDAPLADSLESLQSFYTLYPDTAPAWAAIDAPDEAEEAEETT